MHPIVIYGDEVMRNDVFYVPPERYSAYVTAEARLERMLDGLLAHQEVRRSLQLAEERFRTTIDLMPSAYCTFDPSGRFTFVNREALKLLGKPREQMVGHSIEEVYDSAIAGPIIGWLKQAAATRAATLVRASRDVNGRLQVLDVYVIPVYDEDDVLTMFLTITNDVTDADSPSG
ncbi:MAG TPA: PAS domain-containing protein [Coriobacteriia bacterium]